MGKPLTGHYHHLPCPLASHLQMLSTPWFETRTKKKTERQTNNNQIFNSTFTKKVLQAAEDFVHSSMFHSTLKDYKNHLCWPLK